MTIDDNLERAGNEVMFQESSELSQVMDNLDSAGEKLDVNTRLTPEQISGHLVTEELIEWGILYFVKMSDKSKKLNISRNGLGREDKVRIVAGERQHKGNMTFGEKVKSIFTPQRDEGL